MNAPKINIDIEQINAGSGQPAVNKPTWNPNAGYAREQELMEARQEAWEEHQESLRKSEPLEIRLLKMEGAIAQLQKEIKGAKKL